MPAITTIESVIVPAKGVPSLTSLLKAERLTEQDRVEALSFLSVRPLHTVIMADWILQRGVVSALHRGDFYGYRDYAGELQGVAMIGRNTLFEVRTKEALVALAKQARSCPDVNMIMGEAESLSAFWHYYRERGRSPRLLHRKILFEIQQPFDEDTRVGGLRLATLEDLDLVVLAQAEMVTQEAGTNPLETDEEGFRARCAERVEKGREWIWREGNELIFKADLMSQAAGVCYIEGVWESPTHRGRGICRRCLAVLHQKLFTNAHTICCFVESDDQSACALYLKAGYHPKSQYSKIYL